ncbi:uncharacterized protein LOC115447600 [Manduca sexta]|uniref:Uncharacterized protein n=1 Tax=Manduca sexta TaxID=7130 RepID=A0A922CSL8_MANSE|nr:uncharacterized protein LOC115447600 [Manduca sexta]KAG6456576.1 hypothetical protein O3G_MSEX009808 [Manduca sexta]
MDQITKLTEVINDCLVPKLAQDYDEAKNHPEFIIRQKKLKDNIHNILNIVRDVNLKTVPHASTLIARFIIFYEELKTEGPWTSIQCKQYAQSLDCAFDTVYNVSFHKILSSDVFNAQEIFDECIKTLHQTVTSEDFRRYPALVEVYISLVKNIKKLTVNPSSVLPLSLLLIDDYDSVNKMKGLKCCSVVLVSLNNKSFQDGNFYDVMLGSLLKAAREKDIEIISLVLENLIQLLTILPEYAKKPAIDKAFATILDQINMESNLYRKAACLNFIANVIEIQGINCIIRKSFKTILCNSFDECCNEAVAEILLPSAIEVLEMWIQHCWCTWNLSSDQKLLSILFKLLYITKEESFVSQIHNLIIILIGLCTKKEQVIILESLKSPDIKSNEFLQRLQRINKDLSK